MWHVAVQNVDRIQEQIFQMEMSQNNIITISALQDAAQAGKANLQVRHQPSWTVLASSTSLPVRACCAALHEEWRRGIPFLCAALLLSLIHISEPTRPY